MIEQETASIIKFILDKTGIENKYYYDIPQGFLYPAVYFPPPEISTNGDTFETYALTYSWFIKFFSQQTSDVYNAVFLTLQEMKKRRNLIPLIEEDGTYSGSGIRINDPSINVIEDGTVQLGIEWVSRHPYDADEPVKMQAYHIVGWN